MQKWAAHQNMDAAIRVQWQGEQAYVRKSIVEQDAFAWTVDSVRRVAGVDLSASKVSPQLVCASVVIYDPHSDTMLYQDSEIVRIDQPYIPGFLAFRQIPPLYHLFTRIPPQLRPQLLVVDGNGILHQNQCGLASHLGVLLDTPSIGVGKTFFFIDGLEKGAVRAKCQAEIQAYADYSLLVGDSGRVWGAALRNAHDAVNPVYVSVGHKISLPTAIACVLRLSRYRVVEPVRLADKISREIIAKVDFNQQYNKYPMIYTLLKQ